MARAGANVKSIPLKKPLNQSAGNPSMIMPVSNLLSNVMNGGSHAGDSVCPSSFGLGGNEDGG